MQVVSEAMPAARCTSPRPLQPSLSSPWAPSACGGMCCPLAFVHYCGYTFLPLQCVSFITWLLSSLRHIPPLCSSWPLQGCTNAYNVPSLPLTAAQPHAFMLGPALSDMHDCTPPSALAPPWSSHLHAAGHPRMRLARYTTALLYCSGETRPCTAHRARATPLWWSCSWTKTPMSTRPIRLL